MTLFLDIHHIDAAASPEDIATAHQADLQAQAPFGVTYLRYWLDQKAGRLFCLVDAPDADAAEAVHRTAHGLTAEEIYQVTEHS